MPYSIVKSESPKGWYVITNSTHKAHSKKPFKTKRDATAQLRALQIRAPK